MNLTYKESRTVSVYIGGTTLVGAIKPHKGGWRYQPKGEPTRFAGDTYSSIEAVKKSLES